MKNEIDNEIDKLKAECEHRHRDYLSKLTEWWEEEEKLKEQINKLKAENDSLKDY